MTEICSAVVASNCRQTDSATQMRIFNSWSTNLTVPEHIPERVDLVVTEIFDGALFGEHCLSTLNHAWSHLLQNTPHKKGQVIPAGAQLYVCAIECPEIRKENCVQPDSIPLLDLSGMRMISRTCVMQEDPYTTEDLYSIRNSYRFLSPIHSLLTVDFNDPQNLESLSSCAWDVILDIYADGTVDALAVWFDLDLCEEVKVSTSPSESCCWEQAIFPVVAVEHGKKEQGGTGVHTSPKVNCGDQLKIHCVLNNDCLHLKVEEVVPLGYFLNNCHISAHAHTAAVEGSLSDVCNPSSVAVVIRGSVCEQQEDLQGCSVKKRGGIEEENGTMQLKEVAVFSKCQSSTDVDIEFCDESGEGHVNSHHYFASECVSKSNTSRPNINHCSSSEQESHVISPSHSNELYSSLPTDMPPVNTQHKNSECVYSQSQTNGEQTSDSSLCEETGDSHCMNGIQTRTCEICGKSADSGIECDKEAGDRKTECCCMSMDVEDDCRPDNRHDKDTTDSSASDYVNSPLAQSRNNNARSLQMHQHQHDTPSPQHNIQTDSIPITVCLQREEVRHLNDSKFSFLNLSALQHAQNLIRKTERMLTISDSPPLQGLLALKTGFKGVDFCYVGRSESDEVEGLIDCAGQCNGVSRSQWRWCGGSVEDTVEGYHHGVDFDLVSVDVVEMAGCLRASLVNELKALRSVVTKDVVMIPQAVDVYAILIDSQQLHTMSCVTCDDNTLGISIAPHINKFQTRTFLDLDIHALPHENLSDVTHAFHLDIQSCMTDATSVSSSEGQTELSATSRVTSSECRNMKESGFRILESVFSQSKQLCLTVRKSGNATAMVFWFDQRLVAGVNASTVDPDMNWKQAAFLLNGGRVEEGQEVVITAHLENSYLHFALS